MWAGMMAWMLVFWVMVIVLAFGLAAWLFPTGPGAARSNARDILDSRYARGELTAEQYRTMREELGPEPHRYGRTTGVLIVVLVLAALILVASFGAWSMHGGWWGPGYPGPQPFWMPHMWR